MRALVWFRSDLRTADNTALSLATREATAGVVACFVIAPEMWRAHGYAGVKVDFILRTLRELRDALDRLGIPLVLVRAEGARPHAFGVPAAVVEVAKRVGASCVYFNREVELDEANRDAAVERACGEIGVRVAACEDQSILPPGSVRTGEGKFYTVFTPFKKAFYARCEEVGVQVREKPVAQPAGLARELFSTALEVPARIEGFENHVVDADRLWPAGEEAAERRLAWFLGRGGGAPISTYKDRRDFPAIDATSKLSPYLSVGAITTRRCMAAALEFNRGRFESGDPGAVHWISELVWREFYHQLLVGFPRLCVGKPFKAVTDSLPWRYDKVDFGRWTRGLTGFPLVDAGMRQLAREGWMHNRVRMVVAMFLTKELFIDWRWGEEWFSGHLIDGNLANNNGGWQWCASTGTDAAPYFRYFNPVAQSQKFDPDGAYIRAYVPELRGLTGPEIHEPWTMGGLARANVDYPEPMVDRSLSRSRVMEAFRGLS